MKRDTDRDFFLGAHEAVAYGVVDHVIENERWNEVSLCCMLSGVCHLQFR
jgi:ATP-dependent protease ClpP protease subunit